MSHEVVDSSGMPAYWVKKLPKDEIPYDGIKMTEEQLAALSAPPQERMYAGMTPEQRRKLETEKPDDGVFRGAK